MKKYTLIVPTRNNEQMANNFLINCLSETDYKIILIDDNSDSRIKYFKDGKINVIYNETKKSLTQLWNQGVKTSKTKNVIICSHKARPKKKDFQKLNSLLDEGYGMVALGGFHFFGFNKSLCNYVGMFDEGFTQGWYEDNDFLNKLVINNVSYYLSEEIDEIKTESSWESSHLENKNYYFTKWSEQGDTIVQLKEDLNLSDKEFFKKSKIKYKTHEFSVHLIHGYRFYKNSKKNII